MQPRFVFRKNGTALPAIPPRLRAIATVSPETVSCSCGVARQARRARAHNEEAFRYFLAVERARASRARRCLVLVLIAFRKQPLVSSGMSPAIAESIFSSLWASVRDVDFIGWFREELVAGAVLAQGAHPPDPEVARRIGRRLVETLRRCLPPDAAGRLHVRVVQLPRPRPSVT